MKDREENFSGLPVVDFVSLFLIVTPWYYVDAGIHPSSCSTTIRPSTTNPLHLHGLLVAAQAYVFARTGGWQTARLQWGEVDDLRILCQPSPSNIHN